MSKLSWKKVAQKSCIAEKMEADAVRGMELEGRYRLADGSFDFENCPDKSYVATVKLGDILTERLGRLPSPLEFLGILDEIMRLQQGAERTFEEDKLLSLHREYEGHSS